MNDSDLTYQEDVGYVEQRLNLVSALCTTELMQSEPLSAVDHTCRLFYAMYDNMHREFYHPRAGAAGPAR